MYALEQLLIKRIVHWWFHLSELKASYQLCVGVRLSLGKAMSYERALDRAPKRYLAAIQSLALIRCLQIPPMQVNIGEKQVNVVMGAAPQYLPESAAVTLHETE